MKFVIASNNKHKVKEIKAILKDLNVDILSAEEAGISLENINETGYTFKENAYIKSRAVFNRCEGYSVIADDTGLCVDALNGEPGVFSARYSGKDANDDKNINKLLENMENIPSENRTAKFKTCICCILDDKSIIYTNGECKGKIAMEKKGVEGFGYDSVFIVEGGKTLAQLTDSEKNKISHRGVAIRKLQEELSRIIEEEDSSVK